MLTPQALEIYKQKLLAVLDVYCGTEARELQIITDLQISTAPNARPDDIRQALQSLADQDLASKRKDPLRGWVWKVTPTGHQEAAKLELENGI